jgi:hypothetical protein
MSPNGPAGFAERQNFIVEVLVTELRKYRVDARSTEEAEQSVESQVGESGSDLYDEPLSYDAEVVDVEVDSSYPEES